MIDFMIGHPQVSSWPAHASIFVTILTLLLLQSTCKVHWQMALGLLVGLGTQTWVVVTLAKVSPLSFLGAAEVCMSSSLTTAEAFKQVLNLLVHLCYALQLKHW